MGICKRLAIALMLLCAAPVAHAVGVDDAFRATGSVFIEGDGALDWEVYAATRAADSENVTLRMHASYAHVQTFHMEQPRATLNGVGNGLVVQPDPIEDPGMDGFAVGTFEFHLDAAQKGAVRIMGLNDTFLARTDALAEISPLGTMYRDAQDTAFGHITKVDQRSMVVLDRYTLSDVGSLEGELRGVVVFAVGGTVTLPNGTTVDLPNRSTQEGPVGRDPLTGSGPDVYRSTILVLDVRSLTVEGDGPWHLAATHVEGAFDGDIVWHGVRGGFTFGTDASDDPEVLDVGGRFAVSGAVRPSSGAWAVQGDANRVAIDLEPVLSVNAAVVGGVTLVGVLLGALGYGRSLLAVAVGRLSEPLVSETRRKILRTIHERQPVGMPELQDATGLSRGALRYHLQVLQSAHVLQSFTHAGRGRNVTFVLNGGSLAFTTEALGDDRGAPVHVGKALSTAATHVVRKTIFEHLHAHGPSEPADLHAPVARACGRPVPPSTLSYHLRVLADAGLIRTSTQHARKTYAACIDAGEARRLQYQNLLRNPTWNDAVRAVLGRGSLGVDDLEGVLVASGHGSRKARNAVEALRRACILEPSPHGLRVHPSIADILRSQGAS